MQVYSLRMPTAFLQGSALEEHRYKDREKVPSSFSSQEKYIPPLLGDICLPCSWESPKEDTPPLWIAVCFGRSALSDIKISFSCKLVLVLSLVDMDNQSAPSFLYPALSKEKCRTTYKTNLNPPVFLNPLGPWHTSLNFNFSLFASNLPKLYQAWISCWIQSLGSIRDCLSSSFKRYTFHQTLMYAKISYLFLKLFFSI